MPKKSNHTDPLAEEFKMLSVAVEQTDEHVIIANKEGIVEYVNPAFERTTGYTRDEILGKTPRVLKSGKHDNAFYADMWETILSGKTFRATITNKKKDGQLFHADQTITPIKNDDNEITHFVSVWKDITRQVESHAELERLHAVVKDEKAKLEQILNFGEQIRQITSLNKLIDFIIDQACLILGAKRCSLMLLDETTGELRIRGAMGLKDDVIKESKVNLGDGIAGLVAQEGKPLLVKVIDTDERVGREHKAYYESRSFLSVPILLDQKLIGVVNVTDKKSKEDNVFTPLDLKILLAIVRHSAVSIENAQMYKELRYLTITDPLTSLYNYRHLMESLAYEIKRFKHFKRPLCLLILDVDDFREYNEKFGHLEGDILLKAVSGVLKNVLREVDIVCRYAGDEFVAVLPATNTTAVKRISRIIRKEIGRLKLKRPVTVSMGIAECAKSMNRHALILKADAALYEAKKRGKDQCFCQEKK